MKERAVIGLAVLTIGLLVPFAHRAGANIMGINHVLELKRPLDALALKDWLNTRGIAPSTDASVRLRQIEWKAGTVSAERGISLHYYEPHFQYYSRTTDQGNAFYENIAGTALLFNKDVQSPSGHKEFPPILDRSVFVEVARMLSKVTDREWAHFQKSIFSPIDKQEKEKRKFNLHLYLDRGWSKEEIDAEPDYLSKMWDGNSYPCPLNPRGDPPPLDKCLYTGVKWGSELDLYFNSLDEVPPGLHPVIKKLIEMYEDRTKSKDFSQALLPTTPPASPTSSPTPSSAVK